nr:MAG TPA: type I neck protein [Caudoviricetes sp.]
MRIRFEFEGLNEIQRQLEQLADEAEIKATNKKIFQKCVNVTEPRMRAKIPRSADNSKSGKKGYRPPGHAKDNLPTKVTNTYGEVGWSLLNDAENWFYLKFVEWGTSRQPPRDFIFNVREESDTDYSRIAEVEYQDLLNKKLGGD